MRKNGSINDAPFHYQYRLTSFTRAFLSEKPSRAILFYDNRIDDDLTSNQRQRFKSSFCV
jgi:hypothetical protein